MPAADDLLERLYGAREQDGGREDRAGTHHLPDGEKSADAQHQDLRGDAHELDRARDQRRAVARRQLPADFVDAAARPVALEIGGHPHRADRLGIAQAGVEQGLAGGRRGARLLERSAGNTVVEDRQANQHHAEQQRDGTQRPVDQVERAEVHRNPRQVERGERRLTRETLPQQGEVAQPLAALRRSDHQAPVEAHARAGQDVRAQGIERSEHRERKHRGKRQHQQRRLAAARQDPVVHLQRVNRRREIK